MSAPDLFTGIDQELLDERAGQLLAILVSVAEFARPAPDTDYALFEAAWAKALLTSLAAWIAHPHQDEEQHEEALEGAIAFLREQVGAIGAEPGLAG